MALTTLDNYSNPSSPYIGAISGGLTEGKQIFVKATVPVKGQGFGINLASGPAQDPRDDTPFHFNPRFNKKCVIRNTLQNGKWGKEEKSGPFPFNWDFPFEITIIVEQTQYKVFVNGTHFTTYQHRVPIERVTHLLVEGGNIIIHAIKIDAPGRY